MGEAATLAARLESSMNAAHRGRYLAREHATALLPFLLAPISDERGNFLEDNLHPTAEAQPALRDHVLKALRPLLAGD